MQIKNKLLSFAMVLCILFTMCAPLRAEVIEEPSIEVSFSMLSAPKFTYEMTAENIKKFFEDETRQVIFDPSKTTSEIGIMIVDGIYQLRDITILTFKITDAVSYIGEDPENDLKTLMENIFASVTESMMKKSISASIYTYACELETESLNGKVSDVYMNIAFYLGDNVDKLEDQVINSYIKPMVKEWEALTDAEKIITLNAFILNGQFSYDTEKKFRKSTVEFLKDKKGLCEDYAGLTALFLDEMGLKNIIVTGTVKSESGTLTPHSWNMVEIDGKWYHLDILWNGPVDNNGKHTAINDNYLLKSTKTFASDHNADKKFLEYTKLASEDYVKSTEEQEFDPGRPGISEYDDAKLTLADLLNKAYDIIANHAAEYTSETIKNLNSIYSDAYNVYIKENADLTEIKTVQSMITTAISSLTKADSVNKDNLFYTLGQAYEMLFYADVAALYPASSLRELEKVYNNAVSVYQNENATQNQVNNANWTLWSKVQEIKDSIKEPEVPVEPDIPVEPDVPVEPEVPDEPDVPVEPDEPIEPDVPVEPDEPIEPDVPVEPDEPIEPDIPVEPIEPVVPVIPGDDPIDEKKIPTDIIIYAILALAAAGGILYLIIDAIRKRKNDNDNDEELIPVPQETEVSEENAAEAEAETKNDEAEAVEETQKDEAEAVEGTQKDEAETVAEVKNDETESAAKTKGDNAEKAKDLDNAAVTEETKKPKQKISEESFVIKPAENNKKADSTDKKQAESLTVSPVIISKASSEEEKQPEEAKTPETEENTEEQEKTETAEAKSEATEESAEEPKAEENAETDVTPETPVGAPVTDTETAEELSTDIPVAEAPAVEEEKEPEAIAKEESWAETPADELLEKPEEAAEEELSVVQIQEDIEANRKAAVNILKQINKRKKEIKDNEKE